MEIKFSMKKEVNFVINTLRLYNRAPFWLSKVIRLDCLAFPAFMDIRRLTADLNYSLQSAPEMQGIIWIRYAGSRILVVLLFALCRDYR